MSEANNVQMSLLDDSEASLYRPISRFSHEPFETRQFQFDLTVATVFDDMAARSIPGYFTTQQLSINLCKGFVGDGTRIYDIGSATGTTISMLLSNLPSFLGEIIGIEPSQAMRELCQHKISKTPSHIKTTFDDANIEFAKISNASAILCNYTLHFVPTGSRQAILDKFYKSLVPGGFLILSEKITGGSTQQMKLMRQEYHRFKELNGYSKEEILDKERALSGILIPLSIEENIDMLTKAGFRRIEIAFRSPPFVTLVAWNY